MADEDKTEKATPKRRSELRERGDVLRSREVTTAVILTLTLLSLAFFGTFTFDRLARIASFCFGSGLEADFSAPGVQGIVVRIVLAFCEAMAPIFIAVFIGAIVGNAMQGSITWTMEPLVPKWERLNPFNGFKNLFNFKDRFIDLAKSLMMLVLISWVCYFTVKSEAEKLPMLLDVPVGSYFRFEMGLAFALLKNVTMLYVAIAVIDYLIQRQRFEERNKMTKQEIRDEYRQMEGDPKVKSRIRRLQIEATRRRMMAMVPKADVVITNPTHYAVALMYDPDRMVAPQVVAKGMNLVAQRIIAIAEENRITVYRDPPTARALYRALEPGDSIPADMFKAVAEILAHVYKLTKKAGMKFKPAGAG